jgi:hypothetical protein
MRAKSAVMGAASGWSTSAGRDVAAGRSPVDPVRGAAAGEALPYLYIFWRYIVWRSGWMSQSKGLLKRTPFSGKEGWNWLSHTTKTKRSSNEASPDPTDQAVDEASDHARLSWVYAEGSHELAEGYERLSRRRPKTKQFSNRLHAIPVAGRSDGCRRIRGLSRPIGPGSEIFRSSEVRECLGSRVDALCDRGGGVRDVSTYGSSPA